MVIYDSENGKLYIPGKTDEIFIVTTDDIYEQAYSEGYRDGYQEGMDECEDEAQQA